MTSFILNGRSTGNGVVECFKTRKKFQPVCWRGVSTETGSHSARVLLFGIAYGRDVRALLRCPLLLPLLTTALFLGLLGFELTHRDSAPHEPYTR